MTSNDQTRNSPHQMDENPQERLQGMRLEVSKGVAKGKVFYLEEGTNLIGRWDPDASAFPEVDLESYDSDAKISRKHALIRRSGDGATLEDLGSLNGTFLNRGDKLEKGTRHKLQSGDEIIIGKVFLTFYL
ncbi:MAG: FHA domain-containing protein [Bdellovibrionales bacterium]|nr:FHA domain-containing protein [Bdellovibrionales bacterium]